MKHQKRANSEIKKGREERVEKAKLIFLILLCFVIRSQNNDSSVLFSGTLIIDLVMNQNQRCSV